MSGSSRVVLSGGPDGLVTSVRVNGEPVLASRVAIVAAADAPAVVMITLPAVELDVALQATVRLVSDRAKLVESARSIAEAFTSIPGGALQLASALVEAIGQRSDAAVDARPTAAKQEVPTAPLRLAVVPDDGFDL